MTSTTGMELFSKKEIIKGVKVQVNIWDTAGHEQYRAITRNFYRNSDGVIVVYDVTNKGSFETLKTWIDSIKDNTEKSVKCLVIGNKTDLERQVQFEEAKSFCDQYEINYLETSAKENSGISESFANIVAQIIENKPEKPEGIKLTETPQKNSGCRC